MISNLNNGDALSNYFLQLFSFLFIVCVLDKKLLTVSRFISANIHVNETFGSNLRISYFNEFTPSVFILCTQLLNI